MSAPPPPAVTALEPSFDPARRVLKPLRSWNEVVERVRETSRMAASFLIAAKAYTTEAGGVVIKLEDAFMRDMINREGTPEALRAALSLQLGKKLDATDILYEIDGEKKAEGSLIDLIIEAAES